MFYGCFIVSPVTGASSICGFPSLSSRPGNGLAFGDKRNMPAVAASCLVVAGSTVVLRRRKKQNQAHGALWQTQRALMEVVNPLNHTTMPAATSGHTEEAPVRGGGL